MQIHTRGSHVSKLNPAFVWPPGSGEVVEEVSPYEDFNPEENMNDGGSYGYYNSTILGIAQSFTAHKGGKLTGDKVWARRNLGNVDHLPLDAQISDKCAVAVGVAETVGHLDRDIRANRFRRPNARRLAGANGFCVSRATKQIQFKKDGVYCLAINRPNQERRRLSIRFLHGRGEATRRDNSPRAAAAWLPRARASI